MNIKAIDRLHAGHIQHQCNEKGFFTILQSRVFPATDARDARVYREVGDPFYIQDVVAVFRIRPIDAEKIWKQKMVEFYRAGIALNEAWENVSDIGTVLYPFAYSFDEIVASIGDWVEANKTIRM